MSARRRGLILSVVFLGLAMWLCPEQRAKAQPNRAPDPNTGRHSIWKRDLSPDQIRELLARFGQDDGKGDPFEEMLNKVIRDRNPDASKEQVDALTKRFMNDKEFRDRVIDLAQRQKNLKDNGNGGRPPRELPKDIPNEDRVKLEELAKRLKIQPDNGNGGNGGNGGDPFRVPDEPKFDPNTKLPPFDPQNPNFDPKRFPAIDPKNPPKWDPDTKFPLNPDTGRPFDPRNGRPIDPDNPPKIDPPQPKGNPPIMPKGDPLQPPQPPKIDPNTGKQIDPPNNDGKRKFDPDNPLGPNNDSPDKIAKTKAAEAATALWEKNVGPIDESPAVKKAIIDLVSDNEAMDALTDSKGRNFFESLGNEGKDDKFGGLFGDGNGEGSSWEWPKLDLDWGRNRDMDIDIGQGRDRDRRNQDFTPRESSPRSSSSSGGGGGLGSFDFGGMQVPVLLFVILFALILGALVWWKWGSIVKPRTAAAVAGGPEPWPIDPHDINSREDVVKAFEYLSVLICGPSAKMWTHSTIADELSTLAATHGETAVKLARLYELARYAPLDEPLTRTELMEARRLVCDLAGID